MKIFKEFLSRIMDWLLRGVNRLLRPAIITLLMQIILFSLLATYFGISYSKTSLLVLCFVTTNTLGDFLNTYNTYAYNRVDMVIVKLLYMFIALVIMGVVIIVI